MSQYDIYKGGRKVGTARESSSAGEGLGGCLIIFLLLAVVLIAIPVALSILAPFVTTIPKMLKEKDNRRAFGVTLLFILLISPAAWLSIMYVTAGSYPTHNGQIVFDTSSYDYTELDYQHENRFYGFAYDFGSFHDAIIAIVITVLCVSVFIFGSTRYSWLKRAFLGLKLFLVAYWNGWIGFWKWLKTVFSNPDSKNNYNFDEVLVRQFLAEYRTANGNLIVQDAIMTKIHIELYNAGIPQEQVTNVLNSFIDRETQELLNSGSGS